MQKLSTSCQQTLSNVLVNHSEWMTKNSVSQSHKADAINEANGLLLGILGDPFRPILRCELERS